MKFVSISSLQRTTKPMTENDVVCVMKNNEPVFYTVSPERYAQLLDAEIVRRKAVQHIMDEAVKHIFVDKE